ncbi:hypothetical protein DUI87_15114 [Hirundo rustica rustica]|uniref:tRNA (guanine(9)-N(1))-methyltransferase n=1 Tax=Hirundo rustica rustica TaxID=333673 RepID=A0A3M0K4F3_HIRRU|nr:hypothetical protein DUI87_15114 [Hirundo rustica rustica]
MESGSAAGTEAAASEAEAAVVAEALRLLRIEPSADPGAGAGRRRRGTVLVLEDIDPDKVYVLGGLVDESIHKQLTLRRAREQSLQTARLPIREYMVKAPNARNYHSETLAINQVFDILSTYYETRSWPAALRAGVSSGKGYVLLDTTEQVETLQCATAAQENSLFCDKELHRREAPA